MTEQLAPAGYASSVSFGRTADTNAYSANDVIGSAVAAGGAVQTFGKMGVGGQSVMITSAALEIDINAVISGMTSFSLDLYSASPGSNYGDNAAWDLPAGDRGYYLGSINLGTPVDVGSTLYIEQNGINKQILMGSESIYAYLRTIGGYTPASGSNFRIWLYTVAL